MPLVVEPTSVLQEGSPHRSRRASLKILNRNIQEVVLGNLRFDTWYYSPYPDSIILPPPPAPAFPFTTATSRISGSAADLRNGHHGSFKGDLVCHRLYVCPVCFRYTTVEADFAQHLQVHRTRRGLGEETHDPVPDSAFKVYEWDGYAVWEIDGEREKLYCQNLSLFGKLFLEQKSVFFDTGGFKYYALTYAAPAAESSSSPVATTTTPTATTKGRGRRQTSSSSGVDDDILNRSRLLGFFSKENLSWDSNNLACILIFPPFQHRQLGQLLMAVSYKLSGWEWEGGVIGGPEKPLSAMGRRSYLRFWSERVARFMMGETADADAKKVFHNHNNSSSSGRKKTIHPRKEEMTVKEIGERTGMLGEDVAAALAEMGICKPMVPKGAKKKTTVAEVNGGTVGSPHPEADADQLATMVLQRSQIVEWAERNKVDLVSAVKEEGFLGEWALSDAAESENESAQSSNEESNSV